MSEVYPKMGTLFRLESAKNGEWWSAQDALLPDTAGLFFIDPEQRVVTEKIDGSNMWVDTNRGLIGKRNGVCMTNDKGDQFYVEAGELLLQGIEGHAGVTLFGELVGPKVQSSGQLYPERQFVLFDVLSAEGRFYRWEAVKAVAGLLSVQHVPEIEGPKEWTFAAVREYVTTLQSVLNPQAQAEGIVVRDVQDTSYVRRRIAKIRRKDFK